MKMPLTAPVHMTRRDFGFGAAAGILSVALPHRPSRKLKIGIGTYSYHNLSLDDMISQLTALDISEIEMSRGEFMLMNHPTDDMFRSAGRKFEQASIRCVSYYSATIKDEHDLESALHFAKILGAKNVTGDASAEILARIDERFSQAGLTFGIHNHFFKGQKFAYESTEDILLALGTLSHTVGVTADIGHFASCGYDPVDAIRTLGARLHLVHLKDIQAKGDDVNVLLGQGICKVPEVMQELYRQNYAHLVAIEYEKEGNVNADMKFDVAYARKLAAPSE